MVTAGFGYKNYPRGDAVGWNKKSIGYHSDDGGIYIEKGSNSFIAPTYGDGDEIECKLEITEDGTIFEFLKNDNIVYKSEAYDWPTDNIHGQSNNETK